MIPEPLTITGFVLSVIGFANIARQGAQALYEDTRAYNRAPKKLSKICKWASKLKRSIDLWKMMWGFQEEMHAQYPIALWGDGWPHILSTIESIEEISEEMRQALTPLTREYESQKSSQTSSVTNYPQTLRAEAEQRVLQRDEDQELMNSQFSWDAKIRFILSKSTELDNFIEELKNLIDGPLGLYKLSEREFGTRHQLNTSLTDEERQGIGIVGMLLDQARESRQTSCALYKTCFPAEQGTIALEMSLLGWRDERKNPRLFRAGLPEYLSYYLIIPRTTLSSLAAKSASPKEFQFASGRSIPVQLEVIAEPTNISSGRYKETLIDACADLDQKRTCYLRYTTPGASALTKPVTFKIRRSSDKLLDSTWEELKLSDLLTVVDYPLNLPRTYISLKERVHVAYRIVECAFLLLGTPWLSNFESSCITGAFAEGKEMRYRVDVIPSRGEWPDSIQAQILRVGKLLHEIALGADPEPFQETHLARVTQILGDAYGDALRFCFDPASALRARSSLRLPDQSQVIRDNPLSDFYIEVFEP
ncbi:hypothetical protein JMJ35_005325 [Cladonia borealis]|uniref:Uncharacterized protein n=1 Tax=Cladonia borealis TaxID=184061 RepID=A0AA39QZL5_9LECA|nr:hypothetical protein JMJ35_005325 [Cladonia borealis]